MKKVYAVVEIDILNGWHTKNLGAFSNRRKAEKYISSFIEDQFDNPEVFHRLGDTWLSRFWTYIIESLEVK